jgi:hypothetical protein
VENLKVATWNIRGMTNKELERVRIFEEKKINIAIVTDTKKN